MKQTLETLYGARRAALEAEAAVFDVEDEGNLVSVLEEAVVEARGLPDRTERSFRLQVLADLGARVEHPGGAMLLLDVMNDPDESVRARACAAFASASRRAWPELVHAIDAALEADVSGPMLLVLPGLLLDCSDHERPVPVDALVQLLDHPDADVSAEAACALAEIDAPGVRELLDSFRNDDRTLSDSDDGPDTLGALVQDLLSSLELEDALENPSGSA